MDVQTKKNTKSAFLETVSKRAYKKGKEKRHIKQLFETPTFYNTILDAGF